ncbi:MAG: sigma-70 family RNA polymerase sigma factor [Pirellulaceae bacterium]
MPIPSASTNHQWVTQIVEQYQDRLVRYARRIVGDTQTAHDIVQDTFLKLCHEDQERIRPIVAAWLYRVCRNRALDVQRKERRMNHTGSPELDATTSAAALPEQNMSLREEAAKALSALAQLSENQQEVIRLRIEHGLNYQQIAEITNLSVTNVGYLLHVGLKTLRTKLT